MTAEEVKKMLKKMNEKCSVTSCHNYSTKAPDGCTYMEIKDCDMHRGFMKGFRRGMIVAIEGE